jgi:hypothetical protein
VGASGVGGDGKCGGETGRRLLGGGVSLSKLL